MKKRKKTYDDDGRVIANMNVDGMPWYTDRSKEKSADTNNNNEEISLTKAEQRAMMRGVVLASLLVAGAFVLVGLAFVLFCVFVWFK